MYPVEEVFIDIEDMLGWQISAPTLLAQIFEEAWNRVGDEFQAEYGNSFETDYYIDGQFVVVTIRGIRR